MSELNTIRLALLLGLLISSTCTLGKITDCKSSPKLRFVAQLSVNGCPVFVHDTGANDDGPHLTVEPLMCVTQSLQKVLPRYDQVIQQTYVSVPVMVRDDTMLTEVEHQLRHLSPKSVKFATVSDISIFGDSSSNISALGFDWTTDEPSGIIRFACEKPIGDWCNKSESGIYEKLADLLTYHVSTVAVLEASGTRQSHRYQVAMQNRSLVNQNISSLRYSNFAACSQLQFIRSIAINNCTARVHQRLEIKGHFLIEPLLCHNLTSFINESIMYDYSRDMHYLKLDLVLQDDIILNSVRSELAHLSPLNVTFMRLWRIESVVASALSRRYQVGPLMMSENWRSGQTRVYCRTSDECYRLKSSVSEYPWDFWRHIKWIVSSVMQEREFLCLSVITKYSRQIQTANSDQLPPNVLVPVPSPISSIPCQKLQPSTCKYLVKRNGTEFVVIQQRLTGLFSFQRNWSDYEAGFGDDTDFWIGLSAIHLLSINGPKLRLEMKQWNGTDLYAEYAGFKLGDASTNYTLTIGDFIPDRSSSSLTATGMGYHNKNQFSTLDRQSSSAGSWCFTERLIKNGWWISFCTAFNANGNYGGGTSQADMVWFGNDMSTWLALREVRMMLQFE